MKLIRVYAPLCWFKNHPLELPRSVGFFQKNLYYYLLLELFFTANITAPVEALIEVIIETGLTLLFIISLLYVKKAEASFIPAATSFLICENIIKSLALPVFVWLTSTDDSLSYYILSGLAAWGVAVIAYVIKQILLTTSAIAFVLSLVYFFISHIGAFIVTLIL